FLELLDIAARERGLRADIELFPDGEFGPVVVDARPTARIRLVRDATVKRDPLFAQIVNRHTHRGAYEPRQPSPGALAAINSAASASGTRIGFVTESDNAAIAQHRTIASDAWRIELVTPRTIMESYKVLRVGPAEIAQHRDGLSINTPMVRALTALGLFDRTKAPAPDDAATRNQLDAFNANIAGTPAFFWLITSANDRKTQINSGRAYVRAQLAATAQGLVMHPLSQALQEYPEQAVPYARIHELVRSQGGPVQMWTRLGYAKPAGPSPRRGVDAHILRA
ncbi:MAG: twin-arginine translocation pathway signal protein, partial [Ramlibacter sp.]|nr:twin-arginine translocation pathway signal protein [Ramlibacter sp.]